MVKNIFDRIVTNTSLKYRRIWHLAILFIILTLLFLISLLSYNEIINEKKLRGFFRDLNETERLLTKLDSTNFSYIKGQESLFKYLITHNKEDIQNYFNSLYEVKNMVDTVQHKTISFELPDLNKNTDQDLELNQKYTEMIDSLSHVVMQGLENQKTPGNTYKRLEYNDMAVKTTIETSSSIDSVEKKKFFGRLGDAIKGSVDVQKEKMEMLMILEYQGKKTVGSIDEQMGNIIKMASDYYDKELNMVSKNFSQLTEKNQHLLVNILSLQNLSDEVLDHYKQSLLNQRNILAEKYSVQYTNNRMIRLSTLFGIVILLILLTLAVLYLTKTTYDIEKKLIETKEKVTDNLKLKNKIVSMISHDIRSPLHIILLYLNQVLKLEKNPQKTEVFNSIQYTTNSAYLLANRILDFSKDENNQMTIYKDTFNIHEEVNHILEAFSTLAQSKNNRLINENKLNPSTEVIFDRSKLQRLYFNLLDNAIKHTENGDIEVLSECQKAENGLYKFTLSIKDSGKGIPEDQLQKIFEPFTQASSAMLETQNLGVGLGLYLCKEIVELFHGSISIHSKLNEGTTVSASVFIDKKKD